MEWQIIVALVVIAPIILLPVVLIWYINIAGTVAWLKDRARAKNAARKPDEDLAIRAIVLAHEMDYSAMQRAPGYIGDAAASIVYSRMAI